MWQLSLCHATDSPLPSFFSLLPVAVTVQVNGHLAHDLSCTAEQLADQVTAESI